MSTGSARGADEHDDLAPPGAAEPVDPAGVDLAALDRRVEQWQVDRAARAAAQVRAPMWLAHHHDAQLDRCWRAGDVLVCRRCTLLWPLAFAVMAAVLAGTWWPVGADPWLLVLLPLPGVVEFLLEHAGVLRYRKWRQLLLTVPVAIAIGRLLARYLDDQGDGLFWVIVWGYAIVMFTSSALAHRRAGRGA